MPPSGFKHDAVCGLLEFVRDCYEDTLRRYNETELTEDEVLSRSMEALEDLARVGTDFGVSQRGVSGLARFMQYNFRDLRSEIASGKKPEGAALATEILHISEYLTRFSLPADIEALKAPSR